MNCKHTELNSEARIVKFDDAELFVAEFTVRCAQCGIPFRFLGPPTGLSMAHPTVDVLATTLHAPILPGERSLADIPTKLSFTV